MPPALYKRYGLAAERPASPRGRHDNVEQPINVINDRWKRPSSTYTAAVFGRSLKTFLFSE